MDIVRRYHFDTRRDREVLAEGANQFLDSQLDDARRRLVEHEKRLDALLPGAGATEEEERAALAAFCPGARLDIAVLDMPDGRLPHHWQWAKEQLEAFAEQLLAEERVAVVPGRAFGASGRAAPRAAPPASIAARRSPKCAIASRCRSEPELTSTPSPSVATPVSAGSPRLTPSSPFTSTTTRTGRPNARAKSRSRWSCAGTAMIAPCPYSAST